MSEKKKKRSRTASKKRQSGKKSSPKQARRRAKAVAGGELPSSAKWSQWVAHLANRSEPAMLIDRVPHARSHPLRWALPDQYEQQAGPKLLKQLAALSAGKRFASADAIDLLRQWLGEAESRTPDVLFALEALGWCHALPSAARILSEEIWRELLEQLVAIVDSAGGLDVHEFPVVHQLLLGELPLTLAYLFPEIGRLRSLRANAQSALSYGILELTDGEGMIHARHFHRQRELLACWTRCRLMSPAEEPCCFTEKALNQYEWHVRQSLRTSRSDGSLVLSQGLSGQWCPDLVHSALTQGGDRQDDQIADLSLPGGDGNVSPRQQRKLPAPSHYSEWAETCVMRSSWSRKSPQLSTLFDSRHLRLELCLGPRPLLSGLWQLDLNVDGRLLSTTTDWTELCWFTDEDIDFLELEVDFEKGWKLQRQILLARNDSFLLLADAILGPQRGAIRYRSSLPLADDITFHPEEATSEGYLKNSRPLCTVIPLALPEWRTAVSSGSMELADNHLQMNLDVSAQRLYAPLFFDLRSRRWNAQRTWRQLTIAESLEIQPADVAAGYRVQIGRKQWLIYRSLAAQGNRTLLGQNLSQEFVVAQFDTDGSTRELIEVE